MKHNSSRNLSSVPRNQVLRGNAEDDLHKTVQITPLEFAGPDVRRDDEHPSLRKFIGSSIYLCKSLSEIVRASRHDYPVLIVGETGTGKSIVGQAIHNCSARANKRIVKINSSCFSDGMAESQLFGHERGAFTGAIERRIGSFEAAQGSTLFFDEIGDMPLALQAKLLTALDDKAYPRLGSNTPIRYDARLIFATNRNLKQMVAEGTFRADLYRRIDCLRVEVPPLAERREDIPALVNHALCRHQKHSLREDPYTIDLEAIDLLYRRSWPGNIGELELFVQRLAVEVEERNHITAEDVNRLLQSNKPELGSLYKQGGHNANGNVEEQTNDEHFIAVPAYRVGERASVFLARTFLFTYKALMERNGNSHARVAALMQIHRNNLYRRIATERRHLSLSGDAGNVAPARRGQ